MERSLEDDVQYLKGVGPRSAPALKKAGYATVESLLRARPRRYEDRRNLPALRDLFPGEYATVIGRVKRVDSRPTRSGMVIQQAEITDGTGKVFLTWFNQPWVARTLEKTQAEDGRVVAYGLVKDTGLRFEIASPEWESVDAEEDGEEFARIVPVYPLTEGLQQKLLRRAVASALEFYGDLVEDPLPASVRRENRLRPLLWSLRQIHGPESEDARLEARRRLVFEEFFYLQCALALRRQESATQSGIAFPIADLIEGKGGPASLLDDAAGEPLWDQIHRMLPFELTGAQRRVVAEIFGDMARPHPMNRLVQGDVGSGKTAVAACAILACVRSGHQAALMAPTEILAEQHAMNLRRLFEPMGIRVELLVGKLGVREKKRAREHAAEGLAEVFVGTHALVTESTAFRNLGLAIVDEQHRFGVLQRKALRDKGGVNPDVLVMTATPIPRTLTMTTYGDLDVSVIDELPPGRRPIKTKWRKTMDRDAVYEGVRELVSGGRQAYFVCPMVSESEKMTAQAAEELHARLENVVFPEYGVRLLHGQMRTADKEAAMEEFRAGGSHILVSTTVIEVGVDVPNATVMVIEDANRFGLAQLHQLRGRVGRGAHQSYCVLVADATTDDARERLETMVATTDGFVIAQKDLELRGPGVITGTQQSGNADFQHADLLQDGRLLEEARQAAILATEANPGLRGEEWAGVRRNLQVWGEALGVVTVS